MKLGHVTVYNSILQSARGQPIKRAEKELKRRKKLEALGEAADATTRRAPAPTDLIKMRNLMHLSDRRRRRRRGRRRATTADVGPTEMGRPRPAGSRWDQSAVARAAVFNI